MTVPQWLLTYCFATDSVRAGDRSRTGDLQLGKLTLYQLSYTRNEMKNGAGGIRTPDFCDVNAAL